MTKVSHFSIYPLQYDGGQVTQKIKERDPKALFCARFNIEKRYPGKVDFILKEQSRILDIKSPIPMCNLVVSSLTQDEILDLIKQDLKDPETIRIKQSLRAFSATDYKED